MPEPLVLVHLRLDDDAAAVAAGGGCRVLQHHGNLRLLRVLDRNHRTRAAAVSRRRLCAALAARLRRGSHQPVGVRTRDRLGTRRTAALRKHGMGAGVDVPRHRRRARTADDAEAAPHARSREEGGRTALSDRNCSCCSGNTGARAPGATFNQRALRSLVASIIWSAAGSYTAAIL